MISDVSLVEVELLQMIKCGCAASHPCSIGRCSCATAQWACSMFDGCHAANHCHNKHTRAVTSHEDESEKQDDLSSAFMVMQYKFNESFTCTINKICVNGRCSPCFRCFYTVILHPAQCNLFYIISM